MTSIQMESIICVFVVAIYSYYSQPNTFQI